MYLKFAQLEIVEDIQAKENDMNKDAKIRTRWRCLSNIDVLVDKSAQKKFRREGNQVSARAYFNLECWDKEFEIHLV